MSPPFVPANNTAKVITVFSPTSGNNITIGSCWQKTTAWDNLQLATLLESFSDAWAELMLGFYTTALRVSRFEAYDMEVEGGSYAAKDIVGSALAGSRAGNPAAFNAAMSVTFRTASRGKSFRGRLFHPGLVADDKASARLWGSSLADDLGEAYAALALAVHTDDTLIQQAVVSKKADGVWRSTAVVTPVVAWVGRTKIATQRLRV